MSISDLPHVEKCPESPVNLRDFTTFCTLASADRLIFLHQLSDLEHLHQQLNHQPFIVLGSGSNVLFADDYHGTVVVNRLRGVQMIDEDTEQALVCVAAGEIWHDIVVSLSQRGLYGLENLALIPGTMGAAPVQNIGAYGVEVADFIHSVRVFDILNQQYQDIPADACGFAYRNSHFKQSTWRQRYLITHVTLRLSKTFTPTLSYQGLCQPNIPETSADLLARVIAVRQSKLPDPSVLPNAGSFFKNPIVPRQQLQQLQQHYPEIPFFDIDENHVKIPAAWLIQTVGFKGHQRDNGAGVYEKHALILVNHGQAHGHEIYSLACDIMDKVKTTFAITITPEVRIVGLSK